MFTSCRNVAKECLTSRGNLLILKSPKDGFCCHFAKKVSDTCHDLPKVKETFVCKLFAEFLPACGVSLGGLVSHIGGFCKFRIPRGYGWLFARVRGKQAEAASFFIPKFLARFPHDHELC